MWLGTQLPWLSLHEEAIRVENYTVYRLEHTWRAGQSYQFSAFKQVRQQQQQQQKITACIWQLANLGFLHQRALYGIAVT